MRTICLLVILILGLSLDDELSGSPPSFSRRDRHDREYCYLPRYRYRVIPYYLESPAHRARRTVNSPSLYASPYPFGGLYTWRQFYYGRVNNPLVSRLEAEELHPWIYDPFIDPRLLPFLTIDALRYDLESGRLSSFSPWAKMLMDDDLLVDIAHPLGHEVDLGLVEEGESLSTAAERLQESRDVILDLQRRFFTDTDHRAEDIDQIKLGY